MSACDDKTQALYKLGLGSALHRASHNDDLKTVGFYFSLAETKVQSDGTILLWKSVRNPGSFYPIAFYYYAAFIVLMTQDFYR